MVDTAIILAGGLGTRLRPLTDATPKPLLPIYGKAIVEHIVNNLKKHSVNNIILSIGYKAEQIQEHFKDGKHLGVNISYCIEEEPLGTGGAIQKAAEHITKPFIVLNGDNLGDFNYKEMINLHNKNNAKITIALYPVEDVTQYGIAKLEGERLVQFIEKPKREEAPTNLNNAGAYIIEPSVLSILPKGKSSIERDCFEKVAPSGEVYAFHHQGQWYPTDTLEKYTNAANNFVPN
ncbi:nucleotidyltransferase family protein [Candidatus Woesearchaeota archaeon]|nr:nucleotidyltransferase family protein [Candidatus Woesearchaeota archaeon]